MTTSDHREAAEAQIQAFITSLQGQSATEAREALLRESTALAVAIRAFHMEGIRFRMFNVDRILARTADALPAEAVTAFAEARRHLEAAGFHTRSHQAPI